MTSQSNSVTGMTECLLKPYHYWSILESEYILLHFNEIFKVMNEQDAFGKKYIYSRIFL